MAGRGTKVLRRVNRALVGSAMVAALGAFYIWLVARTTRWTVIGRGEVDQLVARPEGFICIIWHGRLFMSPTYAPPGRRAVAMISNNLDGDLIARIVAWWGVSTVRGSTHDRVKRRSKGGAGAYAGAARELTGNGALIAITPDGPRGPRLKVQAGAATLAFEHDAPVVAVGFSVRWGRILRSWDRFLLPFPFGRGVIVYSGARLPPEEKSALSLTRFRRALEDDLNAVTNRADDMCGRPHTRPEPAGVR